MSDSLQQRNRDDWRSILTVPECTDQQQSTSPFWDTNQLLTKSHLEQMGVRMFAKEFESGEMVVDEETCMSRVIWVQSGTVRVASDNQPSFQMSRGFVIGAKNFFRKQSETFRQFSEGCVCGFISHEDIDSLGLYPLMRVQGMQTVQYQDRIVQFKQGQFDLLVNKEKEKEQLEKHTRDEDEVRKKREKDKIVRNITDASSINVKNKEEKVSKGQYDEVMSRLLASQFASNEAQRANGQQRSEMEQVKQGRDKLQGDQTKANRDKVSMETQLYNLRAELVGEKRAKESAEYQLQDERKQRELNEEQMKYTQVMRTLDNTQREQKLMEDLQQWKRNAHELKESLLVFAENGGKEVGKLQQMLLKKSNECEHWQQQSDTLRVTAQNAGEAWAARCEVLESQLVSATEEQTVGRRQQRQVSNERDHLEGVARQLRATAQRQAVQIQQQQADLFGYISSRSKAKQRILQVGKHMSKDVMGAAVKLQLIKLSVRKQCRAAVTLCSVMPQALTDDFERMQQMQQEQQQDLDEKRPIQMMLSHSHSLIVTLAALVEHGLPRAHAKDASASAKSVASAQAKRLKALALVGEQASKSGLPAAWQTQAMTSVKQTEQPAAMVITSTMEPDAISTPQPTLALPAVLPSLQVPVPVYSKPNNAQYKGKKPASDFVVLHQSQWKQKQGNFEYE